MATGVAMQAAAGVVAVALATTAGARSAPELVPDSSPRRQISVETTLGPGMSTFAGAASAEDAPDDRSAPSSAPAEDGSALIDDSPGDAVGATTDTVGDSVDNTTTDTVGDAMNNTTDTVKDTVTDVADTADGVISDTPLRDTADAGSTIGGVTEDAEGLTNDATDAIDATTDAVLGLGG
jgi:hypothetical protein